MEALGAVAGGSAAAASGRREAACGRVAGSLLAVCVGAVLVFAGGPLAADETLTDYRKYDAVVTDSKGVTTKLTRFGFELGASVLRCTRGDGHLDIPFRNIRTVEIGNYVAERGSSAATVTTRKGTRVAVQISRHEGFRHLGGATEFGRFRIRLEQIRKLELGNPTQARSESPARP